MQVGQAGPAGASCPHALCIGKLQLCFYDHAIDFFHMPCLDLAQCGLPACPEFLPRPCVHFFCCFLGCLGSAGGLSILAVGVMLSAEAPHAVHVARRGRAAFLAVYWVPMRLQLRPYANYPIHVG